jgi:hypothetical protein
MLSAIGVIMLVGLTLPIALILGAIVVDAFFVAWVFIRMAHDDWWPELRHIASDHLITPLHHVHRHGHHAA